MTHALVGILVRERKLDPERPLSLKEWSVPGDARASITANQLLAMAGGLPWDERMGGFDQSTRLWFDEADPYGYAVTVEADALPGTHWAYSNVGYKVLSRLVRDHAGGGAREVLEFAHRELFDRLGMRDAMLTLDGTGTPMGANLFLASARDWARFGLLYLNHGAAGARQLLPADWADAAHVQTLDAGYGRRPDANPCLVADAFFTMLSNRFDDSCPRTESMVTQTRRKTFSQPASLECATGTLIQLLRD